MQDDILPKTLQESLLAVLIFDGPQGAAIAIQIKPEEFDQPYVDLARKVLGYRRTYNQPPGRTHTDDLFAEELRDSKRGYALRKMLAGLYSLHEGLNPAFVVKKVGYFKRKQELKRSIHKAGERYQQGGEAAVEDIESILAAALRMRADVLDPGTFLSDSKALNFLNDPEDDNAVSLDIQELDKARIKLRRKQMLLYIAPKGTGKSWFCVHMGRQGLRNGEKVLHVTLEMPEEDVAERYHQSFFNAAWDAEQYKQVHFEYDELGRILGYKQKGARPRINFSDPDIWKRIKAKRKPWGLKFRRLLIKEFSSGSLTLEQFDAYLEYLEHQLNYIPTMVIVDYPDLMKIPQRDYRLALGGLFVGLRGRAMERNFGLVVPTQSGREGIGAKRVSSHMVSESITKVFTADIVLTYSRTSEEEKLGTGRLHVSHARKAPGGLNILLAQAYNVGQYVLRSAYLGKSYWDFVKEEAVKTDDYGYEEDDE